MGTHLQDAHEQSPLAHLVHDAPQLHPAEAFLLQLEQLHDEQSHEPPEHLEQLAEHLR